MGRVTVKKRIISIILAVLMAFTGVLPAATAFAADDGKLEDWGLTLFYKDTDTSVPKFQEDGVTKYIEYMTEGDELKLTYKFIDNEMPDNSYIKWYSETPTLVDVTQEGVVKAFDSSKGAVIHTWIDNEVKTIPLVGSIMATVIEKALFNEYVNVDTMDTEAIIAVVEGLFGSDSPLAKWVDSYKGELIDSLRYYLDNINSNIHVSLYDAGGTLLDDDFVQICVTKNEEWYANFLPNGTHITNKSQINTTVAVGSKVQLSAVTTPVRLKYGVVYSVKSSSIFDKGKVVATVDDSGLVTFKNTGTVTIMVSPDTEQIIQGILEMVNYIYKLENTGTINTDKVADILIKYIGLDINRNVLRAILDVCFAIKDIAGDAADPVQLTATAVEIISNLVLQFVYNDTITFNVVEAQPITDFSIEGPANVTEGSQIQLSITNVQPEVGDTSDITWTSSDPSIASVDPETGVITGRDAGGALGALSKQSCTIYATSAANNVTKPYTITVTGGKMGQYLSDVEIQGKNYLEMGEETDYTYTVYPKRVADSDILTVTWGIQSGTDEEGNPVYIWADSENPATDGIGTIDSKGHYVVNDGGKCTIVVKAVTGYPLTSDRFYEISSFIRTYEVTNGIPIDDIKIKVDKALGDFTGLKGDPKVVTIEGEEYTYATIEAPTRYGGSGVQLSASVYPENASNQELKWVVDGSDLSKKPSDDTHTVSITRAVTDPKAFTFNVYATSEDGRIKSNVITICVSKNYVTDNKIDQDAIEIVNGYQAEATHTPTFGGNNDGEYSACYNCNWYSSDESVFTVESKGDDKSSAVLTGHDVGVATLYCVTADGGIVDTCQVTVYPDKERLEKIVNICDNTFVKRTTENRTLYNQYMKKLDLAYYVLYDELMASQASCDTRANELLYAFYKIGGFIGLAGVQILDSKNNELENDHITVNVGATTNYTKYSVDFNYRIKPLEAMYSDIKWTSSNDDIEGGITVNKNGVCKPTSNDPCSAIITCTVTDFMGNESSDSVFLTFARTPVTGVSLDKEQITGGKIGETATIKATVTPKPVGVVGGASCTNVYWSSSDESIAIVSNGELKDDSGKVLPAGTVKFVAGGDCIIYCTTYDGGYTAQCAVNVITNYTALELLVQQYNDLQLNYINYYPDTWAKYTAAMTKAQQMLGDGGYSQAEVNAMVNELEKAYKGLQKYNEIKKVELYLDGEETKEFYQYKVSILTDKGFKYTDANLDLNVRLYPNNGSYKSITWESSTTDISVSKEGDCKPTINDACYGLITCTVEDHFGRSFTDSVWVSFARYPVTALKLSDDNISGAIGETHQLVCTVEPTGFAAPPHIGAASIQDYYWESDNEEIATVAQDGTVTFVSAGSTIVRAVSYDGGISAECVVSSEGDRSALRKALEDYKNVDYTDYAYDYGTAFRSAYIHAEDVMNSNAVSQQDIDDAANELVAAYEEMLNHPFIKVNKIDVNYTTYKKALPTSKGDVVASGAVSSSDALSVNLSNRYTNWNSYNFVTLTATPNPGDAMYKTISWNVDSSSKINSEISNNSITLTPKEHGDGAWANITVKFVDQYNREYTRTISVVLSDKTVTGFDITDSELTICATDAPKQLAYTVGGSAEFTAVSWNSSNTDVVTIDANGVITPVNNGKATVTGKTLDGGYTDSVEITVVTDFKPLIQKQKEYQTVIDEVKDSYTYTQESLDVLAQTVAEAQQMITEGRATQEEINLMIEKLDNAFNSLVKYVATAGVSIGFSEDPSVSEINEGFIRYSDAISISGKSITLIPNVEPAGSVYTEMTWTSSNPNITVNNGVVDNNSASAGVSLITCTVKNVFGGEYSASVYVSFVRNTNILKGISFDKERVYGAPAQTVTLAPTFTGSSSISVVAIKDCIYTSSDESIATVDANGVVTFISQGEAIITATALDGGYTATIKAYTTWDTTALSAAIETAKAITYTDYAYDYGTAFKSAYDEAVAVYENIYASQAEIDNACAVLTEATTALQGHEFIAPVVTVSQNGEVLENEGFVKVDENNNAVLDILLNEGAMVKSFDITPADENGVALQLNGNQLSVNKTAEKGSFTLTVRTVDDYDREQINTYTFNVIDNPIPVTSIALTIDGMSVSGAVNYSCGGSYGNFKGVTVGYVPTPANANSIVSVKYTSSNNKYISVDENTGFVEATNLCKIGIRDSYKTTITCTVTNLDGTVVTSSIDITLTRK